MLSRFMSTILLKCLATTMPWAFFFSLFRAVLSAVQKTEQSLMSTFREPELRGSQWVNFHPEFSLLAAKLACALTREGPDRWEDSLQSPKDWASTQPALKCPTYHHRLVATCCVSPAKVQGLQPIGLRKAVQLWTNGATDSSCQMV